MDYKNITKNTYNKIASTVGSTYDDYFVNCVQQEADFFLGFMKKDSKILDIGCGVGTHMKYFIENGYNPSGIDISKEMVSKCKDSGLDVLCADFESMNFNDIKFDGVWAHTSLIHFPKKKWKLILRKISRILRNSGHLFIAVREGSSEGFEIFNGDPQLKRWFSNFEIGEINSYLPKEFEIIRESKTLFRDRVFINIHISKTK